MSEANKALVRRMVEEGTNAGNLAIFDEIIAPDAIDHTAPAGQPNDRTGVKQGVAAFRQAFPDAHATIEYIVAEGDLVAYKVTMRATNTGPFMGQPPTGNAFTAGSLNMVRVVNGQLTEHWSYLDTISMLTQLGLMQPPR